MTNWSTIASAPRDGTPVLVCAKGRPGQVRHWWTSSAGQAGWWNAERTDCATGMAWWKPVEIEAVS